MNCVPERSSLLNIFDHRLERDVQVLELELELGHLLRLHHDVGERAGPRRLPELVQVLRFQLVQGLALDMIELACAENLTAEKNLTVY